MIKRGRWNPHKTISLRGIVPIRRGSLIVLNIEEQGEWINHPSKCVVLLDMIHFVVAYVIGINRAFYGTLKYRSVPERFTSGIGKKRNVAPHHERRINSQRHALGVSGEAELNRMQLSGSAGYEEEREHGDGQDAHQRELYTHSDTV